MGMKKGTSKKSKQEEAEVVTGEVASSEASEFNGDDAKKKKTSKKEKSKKRSRDEDAAAATDDDAATPKATEKLTKEQRAAARAAKKSAKSAEKKNLESKIPKVDEDGIPYNKIQIRRMMRRVKNGLDPIATEEEEREIREREKRERVEEEALYAEVHRDNKDEEEEEDNMDEDDDGKDEGNNDAEEGEEGEAPPPKKKKHGKYHNPPPKGTKRSKPVPSDYTCMACNNKCPNFTPHWIYDCPMKKTVKGCNVVAKKLRGFSEPDNTKVFVDGLPWVCNEGYVRRFFEEGLKDSGAQLVRIHLPLSNKDQSDKNNCKGFAFLTFDSEKSALEVIRTMNVSVWKDIDAPGKSSRSGGSGKKKDEGQKKELKLRVTKMLSRRATAKKGAKKGGGRMHRGKK